MDSSDIAEQIREVREELAEDKAEQEAEEKFRSRTALFIGLLALLMAIAGLGGDNASEDMIINNIRASDTWAFYQAKNVRQTANKIAAAEMEALLLIHGKTLPPVARAEIEKKIGTYKATVERYESEPDPKEPNNPLAGEGKKQLMAQAKDYEEQRDRAAKQDTNFDYAGVLFQVAIVLGSVAILATSRSILIMAAIAGGLACILMLNGFLLLWRLPF